MVKCYGFQSDPADISVRVGKSTRMRVPLGFVVEIDDPDSQNTYSLEPASARRRAELVKEQSESPGCKRLAEAIIKKADEAEHRRKQHASATDKGN